jgi:hypothetical protein
MKKSFILALALIALMSVFSFSTVGAQDEELPACDPMELMTNMEDLMQPLTDLGELSTIGGDAEPSDYSALVSELDAYSYEFWAEFEETEFECAEQYYIAMQMGLILDEALIIAELGALAVHESAAGNTEAATILAEQSSSRAEVLSEAVTGMTDVMTDMMMGSGEGMEPLDSCSEDELTATVDGLTEVNEGYIELSEALDGATGEDLTAAVVGFSTLSTEYWSTFMPEVPECQEAQDIARGYGFILDHSLIMVGLLRLAELEAEAGNDELSETLAESATARAEDLSAMMEEMMGEEE